MSIAIDLADEIVESLNAGEFSRVFTAKRVKDWRPNARLVEAANELQVLVVPTGRTATPESRTSRLLTLVTDVAVVRGVTLEEINTEELDALMDVVEEIDSHLYQDEGIRDFIGSELIYPDEQLIQEFAFVAIVRVTYRKNTNIV